MAKVYLISLTEIANTDAPNNVGRYSKLFLWGVENHCTMKVQGVKTNGKMITFLTVSFTSKEKKEEFNRMVANVYGVYPISDINETVAKVLGLSIH